MEAPLAVVTLIFGISFLVRYNIGSSVPQSSKEAWRSALLREHFLGFLRLVLWHPTNTFKPLLQVQLSETVKVYDGLID